MSPNHPPDHTSELFPELLPDQAPMHTPILPGATIGVFGSGQLGRMLGLAARPMGYRFACYSPDGESPAQRVADFAAIGAYEDMKALRAFVRRVDVLTFEFENVPAIVAQVAESEGVPLHPSGAVLHTTQNRVREKQFLHKHGLPVAPFAAVETFAQLYQALIEIGTPAVLKSAAYGYDGKGQVRIDGMEDAEGAWQALGAEPAIVEQWLTFALEISVVAARGATGEFVAYPPFENRHYHHILDTTVAPARIADDTSQEAIALTRTIFETLGIVGTACVEMFVLGSGEVMINEIAPRPHNSGHLTIEASPVSQFEQQARAICGLPLGQSSVRPAAMANLLGDLWYATGDYLEPDWAAALRLPGVKLHLYGKQEARRGRKMGHLTAVANTVAEAEYLVSTARRALGRV